MCEGAYSTLHTDEFAGIPGEACMTYVDMLFGNTRHGGDFGGMLCV